MTDLGPCGVGNCTADAVAYLRRTLGQSARITIVTGPNAVWLANGPVTADAEATVCHEHAAVALDDLLREANRLASLIPESPKEN